MTACLFEQVLIVMREQKDWLFRMIHNFVGQVRLIVENQCDIVLARDIFGRNDREFIPRNEVNTASFFLLFLWERLGEGAQHSGWLIWTIRSFGCLRVFERDRLDASTRD